MIKLLFSRMNKTFLLVNLASVLFFAIIYYVQDIFILSNVKFAQEWGLLEDPIPKQYYSWKQSPFYYYIWYSLITQTTVGYGGIVDTVTAKTVPFLKLPNKLFKALNIMQLLSIILIAAIFLDR